MRRLSVLLLVLTSSATAFVVNPPSSRTTFRHCGNQQQLASGLRASSSSVDTDLSQQVQQLKNVLAREYTSFFNPMEREWYSSTVSFTDPLTSLSGVDAYQSNVDMLASRTLMGKWLFENAGIVLHSVTGGEINDNGSSISNIVTRWTLRLTAKVLPWQPTARFSGISVYQVQPGGDKGVEIVHQTDYWDSINLLPATEGGGKAEEGQYATVDKGKALADFLGQLAPPNNGLAFAAPSIPMPELPYQLLRRAQDYTVRRYPSMLAVKTPYTRRDEAFERLGSVTRGTSEALAPAILQIPEDGSKTMLWPCAFAAPGEQASVSDTLKAQIAEYSECELVALPEQVIAVGTYSEASVEPVVRRVNGELRSALQRDGLIAASGDLQFAQYDAVFTLGTRRGEVWVPLQDGGHPW